MTLDLVKELVEARWSGNNDKKAKQVHSCAKDALASSTGKGKIQRRQALQLHCTFAHVMLKEHAIFQGTCHMISNGEEMQCVPNGLEVFKRYL